MSRLMQLEHTMWFGQQNCKGARLGWFEEEGEVEGRAIGLLTALRLPRWSRDLLNTLYSGQLPLILCIQCMQGPL